jgi:hypothetical protein
MFQAELGSGAYLNSEPIQSRHGADRRLFSDRFLPASATKT